MTKRQEALLARLEVWFEENEHMSVGDAAQAMHMPPAAAQAVTAIGINEGRLVLIGDKVYTTLWLEKFFTKLFAELGTEPFPPSRLREVVGQGRQWTNALAICLEEQRLLDREAGGWCLKQRA